MLRCNRATKSNQTFKTIKFGIDIMQCVYYNKIPHSDIFIQDSCHIFNNQMKSYLEIRERFTKLKYNIEKVLCTKE